MIVSCRRPVLIGSYLREAEKPASLRKCRLGAVCRHEFGRSQTKQIKASNTEKFFISGIPANTVRRQGVVEITMTKGAIGNLINRYRSVLNKCRLNNMLAKMFVAGTVMLAAPLMVESLTSVSGDSFFVKTAQAASEHEIGPGVTTGDNVWWWNGPLTVTGPDTTVNGNIGWWPDRPDTVTDPEPALTVQGPKSSPSLCVNCLQG